ncbi:DNA fragmentation factor subunit alpha-like [Hyperolius riggenbachi]|uniref:DNA fragmentation factor subunit alpha-like n=1 Tax=Hyperolius riggenbachi TaxID=752182 RepID=UPI0035A29DFE
MKHCIFTVRASKARHEVCVASLQELKEKALQVHKLNALKVSISVVLAKDGTRVDSDDFFLCLPDSTEFIALIGSKKWARTRPDGGTAWMDEDPVEETMYTPKLEPCREDPPNIFLYSEMDDSSSDVCTPTAQRQIPLVWKENVLSASDINGNVQNQPQAKCEPLQRMNLLTSVCRLAKEKLSPKLQRKPQNIMAQAKEDLQGNIQT